MFLKWLIAIHQYFDGLISSLIVETILCIGILEFIFIEESFQHDPWKFGKMRIEIAHDIFQFLQKVTVQLVDLLDVAKKVTVHFLVGNNDLGRF